MIPSHLASPRLAWLVCYIACHDVNLRANILPVVPYTLFARYVLPTATVLPAAAALPTAHGRGIGHIANGRHVTKRRHVAAAQRHSPRRVTGRVSRTAAAARRTNGYRVPHSVSI